TTNYLLNVRFRSIGPQTPYLFEEDATGNYETTVWIVGESDGNVTMLPMSWKNFLSVCTIHPFICPQCGTSHLPPA
ncbi:hypothetical protein, partial [Escherichia coli]|uniref:hypothetical protein n=1 Tax=Escherichia coli TaxID=562 RepID=UPI000D0509B5